MWIRECLNLARWSFWTFPLSWLVYCGFFWNIGKCINLQPSHMTVCEVVKKFDVWIVGLFFLGGGSSKWKIHVHVHKSYSRILFYKLIFYLIFFFIIQVVYELKIKYFPLSLPKPNHRHESSPGFCCESAGLPSCCEHLCACLWYLYITFCDNFTEIGLYDTENDHLR